MKWWVLTWFRSGFTSVWSSTQLEPPFSFDSTKFWSTITDAPNLQSDLCVKSHPAPKYFTKSHDNHGIELAIDYLRRNAPLSVALSGISFFDRNLCCYDIPISNLRQTQIWPLGHITVPPKCNTKHANWTPLIRSYQKHANFGSTSILLWLSPQTSKWLKCRWRYIALMYGTSSNHHRLILLRWFTRRHHLHGWQC